MRYRGTRLVATLASLAALSGCGLLPGETREVISIPPASAGPSSDSGFGQGVRALSFGPGDKGSPRMSPSGERISFVLDGRVAEKPLYSQDPSLSTGEDLRAEHAEWLPDGTLAALGVKEEDQKAETAVSSSLFAVRGEDTSTDDRELVERVEAAGTLPDGGVVVAAEVPPARGSVEEQTESWMVLLKGSETPMKFYLKGIEGRVTGLSVSPDGSRAMLAVLRDGGGGGGGGGQFEIQVYRFSDSRASLAARLPEGMEVLGAPQWTSQGAYFVAGGDAVSGADPGPYALYRTVPGSEEPEPVSAVGEGFVAANASVSPDGDRLAVIGRRNPSSPTNLYVLNLDSGTLDAATTNEDMEIKTDPHDLTWSPDGRSVILVAREALSGPAVYDVPAEELSSAFYNLYQVPVGAAGDAE
jgi:Tol biopolymer transport system component